MVTGSLDPTPYLYDAKGSIVMAGVEPNQISADLKDFICDALHRDPAKRPTVNELIDHSFITKASNSKTSIAINSHANTYTDLNEMSTELISKFQVHDRDTDGKTMLHSACSKGMVTVVRHLLSLGASVFDVDREKQTPLHLAAMVTREISEKFLIL